MMNTDGLIRANLQDRLMSFGFDILHPFSLEGIDEELLNSLSVDDPTNTTGYLIGNTASIWEPFIMWLAQQANWSDIGDPLETYVEEIIEQCVEIDHAGVRIFWTHETERYVLPVQRIAHSTGLAYLSAGQFNIHPRFGPWFALRAVVVFSGETNQNSSVSNPSSDSIEGKAAALFNHLLAHHASWQEWLSLRDLYTVGRAYRYSAAQIQYHYTRDKTVLFDEIQRLDS